MGKRLIIITLVFATLLFATPLIWNNCFGSGGAFAVFGLSFKKSENFIDSFRLKLTETDEIIEISAEDYIIGCLFAQIPITYHENALKAQAVAAYTYALRMTRDNRLLQSGGDYDLTDSSVTCQPYFTEEKARDYYGEEYDNYYEKIRECAGYGASHILEFNDLPIYAVYHSISNGMTNTGMSVWGRNLPYLQSADSSWDKEHNNYLCTNEITVEKMRAMLLDYSRGITMPIDYSLWFSKPTVNAAGYIESMMVGDTIISGGDIWRIFNLRSTDFTVEYTGSVFLFTTKGYGHGVGLSQYGADYMAKCGYTAEEILLHYYSGVKMV